MVDVTPARCTPVDNPELARSLRFRFPYVDALNHCRSSCCGGGAAATTTS